MCVSPAIFQLLRGNVDSLGNSMNLGIPTIVHKPKKPTFFSLTQMPIDV